MQSKQNTTKRKTNATMLTIYLHDGGKRVVRPSDDFDGDFDGLAKALEPNYYTYKVS